jgi:Fur family peroxide stress response transcriptional regulator
MSVHQSKTPTPAQDQAFVEAFRTAGLKATHQRLTIYRELASRDDHPSAEAVFVGVRAKLPTVALDTVYRTLKTFEDMNLAKRLDIFDDQARFDANMEPHHHCVCNRCDKIVDFHWDQFDLLTLPGSAEEWGTVMDRSVVFRGICRDCLLRSRGK